MKKPGCLIASLLLLGPPLLAPLVSNLPESRAGDTLRLSLAIGWIFVSIPVATVVFLDWFRTASSSGSSGMLRQVARLPLFLLGLTAVLIGAAVLAWVAYNLVVARQPELRWSGLGTFEAMVLMIMFGFYLIRTSLGHRPRASVRSDALATYYGLDRNLHTVEHGPVGVAAAIDVARSVYERHRTSYESAEEALADTMFGFSRAQDDFIELCVNGLDNISVTVEVPIDAGWGHSRTSFRDERTVHSLGDVEALLRLYFTLSHDDLRAALRDSSHN